MTQDFTNKVAIVTGAGKGLGRAYAIWLARRGARLVVNNRVHPDQPSSAEAVAAEIRAFGGEAISDHAAAGDDPDSAIAMVTRAREHFGGLDILICNAGITDDVDFGSMSHALMRQVMDINFWGSVHAVQAALPLMFARSFGRIVLSTSQAGLFGQRRATLYSASKAALIGFSRGVALDIGREITGRDVTINCVAPAAFTPMSKSKLKPEWAEIMSPFKVAPAVGWLCSDACQESGMIFNVGGGHVRRARIVENAPVDIVGDDLSTCFPDLDSFENLVEARSSYDSGRLLIPELYED